MEGMQTTPPLDASELRFRAGVMSRSPVLPAHLMYRGDVCRTLRLTPDVVDRLVGGGYLRPLWRGARRVFVRDQVGALAARLPEIVNPTAVALRLMREGRSDFEILATALVRLPQLRELRAAYARHVERGLRDPCPPPRFVCVHAQCGCSPGCDREAEDPVLASAVCVPCDPAS